jgi:hypothetical protein
MILEPGGKAFPFLPTTGGLKALDETGQRPRRFRPISGPLDVIE